MASSLTFPRMISRSARSLNSKPKKSTFTPGHLATRRASSTTTCTAHHRPAIMSGGDADVGGQFYTKEIS